jgi:hypothetical protein
MTLDGDEIRERVHHPRRSDDHQDNQVFSYSEEDDHRGRARLGDRPGKRQRDLRADAESSVNSSNPGGGVTSRVRAYLKAEAAHATTPSRRVTPNAHDDQTLSPQQPDRRVPHFMHKNKHRRSK